MRNLRLHLLDGADLGVKGLAIGDGELRLNGHPFEQASEAEKTTVACLVAMRQNPALKLMRVDDLEHMGVHSRRILFEMADKYDWQILCAAVVLGQEELKIEVIEGAPAQALAPATVA
jgi:hypothetical protein